MVVVGSIGAWIWLGAAGSALVALWCAAVPPWRAESFTLLMPNRFRAVEAWRLVCFDGQRWVEVFVDEVSAGDWNALHRAARGASVSDVEKLSRPRAEAHPTDLRNRGR